MKTTKINEPFVGFVVGILIFLTGIIIFSGCGSDEKTVSDTFIHPDSNIAAEMKIRAEFDTLNDSVK